MSLNQAQIWIRDTHIQGFIDRRKQCSLLDADWRVILQRHLNRQSKTEGTHAKIYQNPFYSNPKSFVNFLLPDREFGEGWGGVKDLRLLQGFLY